MADSKITDLTLLTSPNGAEVYAVKAGDDYRLAVGGNNGISYLGAAGLVPTAQLGTGTANSSSFLRGDGTWAASGGSGTVTSVAATGSTGLTVGGSPITGSGTLTLTLNANLQSWSAIAPSAKANASHTHVVGDITATGTPSSTTYLRGDGVWATPAGGGGGSGTVTSVGVSVGTGMSVSNTPVTSSGTIGVSLNSNLQGWSAIAPASKADAVHTHTATDITSGTMATARLGSGTANSTTFLRGDGSWATPAGGGSGTVTSVAATGSTGLTVGGSPVTSSGTLTFTLSANLQSWSAIAPSAKADTSHTHAATDITSGTMSPARLGAGTANSGKFLRGDSTWQDITSGTVTSVALSGGTTGISVTGSPITTSGTMTLGGVLAVANGGTGGSTASAGRNGLGIYVQSGDPGAVADGSLWIW